MLFDEYLRQFFGDALRPFRRVIQIHDVERIQFRLARRSRDGRRHFDFDSADHSLHRLIDRTIGDQMLFAGDPFEDRRAGELLRESAQPLIAAKAGAPRRTTVGASIPIRALDR